MKCKEHIIALLKMGKWSSESELTDMFHRLLQNIMEIRNVSFF